jgi:hypothetical protein
MTEPASTDLQVAEESLRDIRERVEHAGTPDILMRDINKILDIYWRSKKERRDFKPR